MMFIAPYASTECRDPIARPCGQEWNLDNQKPKMSIGQEGKVHLTLNNTHHVWLWHTLCWHKSFHRHLNTRFNTRVLKKAVLSRIGVKYVSQQSVHNRVKGERVLHFYKSKCMLMVLCIHSFYLQLCTVNHCQVWAVNSTNRNKLCRVVLADLKHRST